MFTKQLSNASLFSERIKTNMAPNVNVDRQLLYSCSDVIVERIR